MNEKRDGWGNIFTGMGNLNRDKKMSTVYGTCNRLSQQELTEIFRGDGLGNRIITVPVGDMLREWFTVTGDTGGEVNMRLDELSAKTIFDEALMWDRLYGGSVILMFIDDGQELDQPVNEEQIIDVMGFQVYERYYVTWSTSDLYQNRIDPNYGNPEFYNVMNISTGVTFRVHESRVMRFNGELVPVLSRQENQGWGDSVIIKIYDRLRGLAEGYDGLEHIVTDFVTNILKVKNLDSLMATAGGTEKVINRLQMIDMTRHIMNTMILDDGEVLERIVSAGATGVADILIHLIDVLVAVSGIPKVKLFGEQSQGLGSEASGNIRMYYDEIASMQLKKLQKPLEKLVRYIIKSKNMDEEIDDWTIEFNPLWQPSESEEANTKKIIAETDNIYYNMGLPEQLIFATRFTEAATASIKVPAELIEYYKKTSVAVNKGIAPKELEEVEPKEGA